MGFWGDVHRRSIGQELRKEDEVQFDVCMDYVSLYPRLIDLKSAQIELNHMSEELTKKINRLRWDLRKMKKQLKCYDRV